MTGHVTRSRPLAALCGLAAALAGLGVGQVVALLVDERSAPLIVVADAFVDLTPPWLKDAAISTFGTHDKQALLIGAAIVLLLLAAASGLVALRSPGAGLVLVAGVSALPALAAVTRPDAGAAWIVPSVVAGITAMLVLRAGIARLRGPGSLPDVVPYPVTLRGAVPDDGDPGRTADAGPAGPGEAGPADPGEAGHGQTTHGPSDAEGPAAVDGVPATSRRRVLRFASLAGGAGLLAWLGGAFVARGAGEVAASRADVLIPDPTDTVPRATSTGPAPTGSGTTGPAVLAPTPEGADLGVPGADPWLTPNDDFYRIDTALIVPKVRAEDWTLRIHGMVEHELEIDFAELSRRAGVERYVTINCVSNPVGGTLIGNALWQGMPIADLIAQVKPLPESDMLLSTSADGFTCGTPVAALTDGRDALLAIAMNGEPLPIEHGFPVRMIVPGLYGFVSATKWVVEWEFTRFDRAEAYWTPRGWAERAPVKTASRIDTPGGSDRLAAGEVTVAGVAWAQHRGVRAVEVRVDEGPWQPAELAEDPSIDTWRQWVLRWQATSGDHVLQVRAQDGAGEWQTGETAPPAPDGATGWHTVRVAVA